MTEERMDGRLLTDEEIQEAVGDTWEAFPMEVFRKLNAVQDAKSISRILREIETEGAITFLTSSRYQNKKLWAIPYEYWQSLSSKFLGVNHG